MGNSTENKAERKKGDKTIMMNAKEIKEQRLTGESFIWRGESEYL